MYAKIAKWIVLSLIGIIVYGVGVELTDRHHDVLFPDHVDVYYYKAIDNRVYKNHSNCVWVSVVWPISEPIQIGIHLSRTIFENNK